jgi:lipid A 3-O-deacylase
MRKLISIFFFLFFVLIIKAQKQNLKSFQQEITVITDNDNYDFELTDRYYSNGFIIQYNKAVNKLSNTIDKKILRFEAAHKVYNPYINNQSLQLVVKNMDRPYAGWLYLSGGITQISKKQNVLLYGAAVGIMGPGARGRQIQNGWHKIIGIYETYGWEYQLQNEAGFNLSAEYYHSLVKAKPGKNISLHTLTRATLGNTFTNASAGFLLKTGWLNSENESGYWSGNLGASSSSFKRNEFIFFLEPALQYQAYNATVQGGLFIKDKGPFTTGINPFVFQTKTGIMLSGNRMGLRWYYTFRTKEGSNMKQGEHWGSIGATYRFK